MDEYIKDTFSANIYQVLGDYTKVEELNSSRQKIRDSLEHFSYYPDKIDAAPATD